MIKLSKILEDIKSQQYEIFCDIDGVLASFDEGFKKLTGYYPNDYEQKFGIDAFWKAIPEDTTDFWKNLQWMPAGKALWNYISKYSPKLLSAPSKHITSKIGKKEWVERELPGTKLILKGAKYKHEYAKPNRILIDDRADNCERWENAGGIAVVFTSTPQTIRNLKKLGL